MANIGEQSKEGEQEGFILGEEGQRLAHYALGIEEAPIEVYLDDDGIQHKLELPGELSVQEETEIWLRRRGVDKALVQGLGKGPDGIALAKVAAKRLKGKENGEMGCKGGEIIELKS